jgi:hypothetical protein
VAGNILFYFLFCFVLFSFCKKNNKILPVTSACCGAVVRNECKDHLSFSYKCHEEVVGQM